MSIAVALFIQAMQKKSNILFMFSGLFFGLSLYTYALSYIIIPVLLFLIFVYLLYAKKIEIKQIIIFAVPLFIFALPLMLMILVNNGFIDEIDGFITIPKLPGYRGSEINISNILSSSYIITCIFGYDNPVIFGNTLVYNALPHFGTIYYLAIPFFVVGFAKGVKKAHFAIKNKEFTINIIILFWFISVILCQLLIQFPNINKANAIFVPILYFVTIGIAHVVNKNKSLILPIILLFVMNFALFFDYYFYRYNEKMENQWLFAASYLDALEYSKTLERKNIYVSDEICTEGYIYVLLNNKISPYDFKRDNITIDYNGTEVTYIFRIPDDGSLDDVYIVSKDDEIAGSFINIGFSSKEFDDVVVFYME